MLSAPKKVSTPDSPQALRSLSDDWDSTPPAYKRHGEDWRVVFNKHVPRQCDVRLLHTFEHDSVVPCVCFSVDGKYLATGCNRTAQIFDVKTGAKLSTLKHEPPDPLRDLYVRSVRFSPAGGYLATGADDNVIRIWDLEKREIKDRFEGHKQDVYTLDFSRDGSRLASGSRDGTVRLWDMETGQCLSVLSIQDGVTTVEFSPDGKALAAGALDKSVRIWDTENGNMIGRLEGHKDSVYSVAFSPSGKLLSGSLDKTIKMWDVSASDLNTIRPPAPGVCERTFVGHDDFVVSVAVSPDGKWVVSGSKDRCVLFWDPTDGQPHFRVEGHKNTGTPTPLLLCRRGAMACFRFETNKVLVISVAVAPFLGGNIFATGSGDCRARIWNYDLER